MDTLYRYWQKIARGEITNPHRQYKHPASEGQIASIERAQISVTPSTLTRGHAADLIGLTTPPASREIEILNVLRFPISQIRNETIAQIKCIELLKNPRNLERWQNRPSTAIQKALLDWFEISYPNDLTYRQANSLQFERELTERQEEEWDAIESILSELTQEYFLEDHEIEKPSIAEVIDVLKKRKRKRYKLTDLDASEIVPDLIESRPSLQTKT